jgi:histone H2A
MAAVLEYITAELIELAGNTCVADKRRTITPKHINLGIKSDEELAKLMSTACISQGGQAANINEALLR